MNHRLLQRVLFRMQLDPSFAQSVLNGDADTLTGTGLPSEELVLLRRAPLAGVTADPGHRRRHQVLGNIASEYTLSVAVLTTLFGPEVATEFLESRHFHDAVTLGERLPFAFGQHLQGRCATADPRARGLVRLEMALVEARRSIVDRPAPRASEVVLAPNARVLELPGGTWTVAEQVQTGARFDVTTAAASESDWVLIQSTPAQRPGGLRPVVTEPLQPMVSALLRRTESPWGAEDRGAFARELNVAIDDVDAFLRDLLRERTLVGTLD